MRLSGELNAGPWCMAASPTQAAPFTYVTNEKSVTISVIDTVSDTVVGEIRAGKKPRGAAFAGDGKTLFVHDQPNNNRWSWTCRGARSLPRSRSAIRRRAYTQRRMARCWPPPSRSKMRSSSLIPPVRFHKFFNPHPFQRVDHRLQLQRQRPNLRSNLGHQLPLN